MHPTTFEPMKENLPERPISEYLQELYKSIDSIELLDLQNTAHEIQNPPNKVYIGRVISVALEALQEEHLSIMERIWALTFLDALRASLPSRELIGIRTNVAEGPVFRGALELHLTQGKLWRFRIYRHCVIC